MDQTLEKRTIAKVSWRLLPLIVIIYFVAYIDRTNVGFAAIGMNKELGFTAYLYGWGAGIFFLGYFLFEVGTSWWALAAMSVATVGLYGSKPAFWPLPSEFLSREGAAAGIALV